MRNLKRRLPLIISFILIFIVLFMTSCKKQIPNTSVIFTVNDKEVILADMMFYILPYEEGEKYSDYWDNEADEDWFVGDGVEVEEGETVRDFLKRYILEVAIRHEIFYQEALKTGYSLTDSEIRLANEVAISTIEEMDKDALKITGYTEKRLSGLMQKIFLNMNYSDVIREGIMVDKTKNEFDIMEEKDKKFMEIYNQIKESYTVKINADNWDSLTLGEITTPQQ